jgi:YidC/Oxa1 family membrane protein insertase
VQPIFNLLLGIYSLIPGRDFGVAIIIFTILIRFALFPLVKKQLRQSRKMRELQPELQKIKKQAKGNKQLESVQMMELYKKYDVKPFQSMLVLLIQLPIFIALFRVIHTITINRGDVSKYIYGFLKNIEPIRQIINHPDQFHERLFGLIDLTQSATKPNIALIIIVIVAVVAQYIMTKQLTPQKTTDKRFRDIMAEASSGQKTNQAEMNAAMTRKMSKVTPLIMLFIMINLPGALVLYYAVSNWVAVAQQNYVLKKDEQELEQIANEKPVVKESKKATAKARAKVAREANVTRIIAKDSSSNNTKQKG